MGTRLVRAPGLGRLLLLGFFLALVLGTLSCGGENGTGLQEPPPCTNTDDCVQRAYYELENALFEAANSNPEYPRDLDFSAANTFYRQALAFDGTNLHARFGTALTGIMALTTDTEVNAAFDEWKRYLDAHTPFEVPGGSAAMLGVPVGMPSGSDGLRLPFDLVPQSVLALGRAPILAADPQIGRVQEILRARVLPRLAAALPQLQVVAQNPSYVFQVSPRMQGDAAESWRELDQTDVLALRAGCSLLDAACRIAVSYNLGFAAYDSTTLVNSLQRGSGWLTLAAGGVEQMANARTSILGATYDVDAALTALLAETDNQDDDIIKIGPNDLARADVDSIQDNLPNVRQALTSTYTRTENWDGDDATPDEPLTIALGTWFTNPVQDWKALLPSYAVTTERRVHGRSGWHQIQGSTTADVSIASDGYYSANCYISVGEQGEEWVSSWGSPEILPQVISACRAALDSIPAGECFDWASASAAFSSSLAPGLHRITIPWTVSYDSGACVVVPVIDWTAASFAEWTFLDPTLGGLFPEMGTTSDLLGTFGVTAQDWEPRWVIDWTN